MVLKRKEVVAAALVVLIGVAGYLNWSYQDTVRVTDGEEYIATGKRLGEAQLVNSSETAEETNSAQNTEKTSKKDKKEQDKAAADDDYFTQARKNRETSREKSLDILNQTAANENFDEATRQKAQEDILAMANAVAKEAEIENVIKAKGYPDAAVYIDGEKVEMVVKKDGFTDSDAAKLSEAATEKLGVSPANIKIVPVK